MATRVQQIPVRVIHVETSLWFILLAMMGSFVMGLICVVHLENVQFIPREILVPKQLATTARRIPIVALIRWERLVTMDSFVMVWIRVVMELVYIQAIPVHEIYTAPKQQNHVNKHQKQLQQHLN